MSIDEVLSMLSSLIKFIGSKHDINVGIIVPKLCSKDLISKFKRNNVLGIVPGMRFFDKENSITAYNTLIKGQPHWPAIAIQEYSSIKPKTLTLTDRQYEVFNLVARRGYTNKQISKMLSISEDTVKFHLGTIFKKYGVKNRTQLALAVDTGVITYH
jgi:DNA-binding NarL/FixJ family response regulator